MEVNLENKFLSNEKRYRVHVSINEPNRFEILKQYINNKSSQLFFKRSFDIAFSLTLIILFFPVFALTALLIIFTSKGPILYTSKRIGLKGKYFDCYKFRSMAKNYSDGHYDHEHAVEYAENGMLHKQKNDSRVTIVGKFIRKTSIDELPQLFNVLVGDMSIVGPRPLVPFMLVNYPEFKQIRNLVRPGITGLWQVREREKNTSAAFMMKHDIEYIENYTFLLDIKILTETPLVVLSGKGAY